MKKPNYNEMEKPIKPIAPELKKYKRETKFLTENSPFTIAYRKYQKEWEKYEVDIVLYEQIKLMKDIQRSDLRLCLKKYVVAKK